VFGVAFLLLAIVDIGLIIGSKFWWGFIGVGLQLLASVCLLAGNLLKKSVLYYPFLAFCVSFNDFNSSYRFQALCFLFNVGLMLYWFISGSNQFDLDTPSSSNATTATMSSSTKTKAFVSLGYAAEMFLKLCFFAAAFFVAFADMRYVKKECESMKLGDQLRNRPIQRVAYNNKGATCVIEDVEVIEQHRERGVDPYY
jgi:hypothetical protein